mmetsp:Transcript_21963/g.16306  ORF Transcript_21963/g.16306 Transcript_21963/m.16306 type:complete len:138 (-) Transcript_21963:537-950(-)
MRSFSLCQSYAEQALNAIKVVAAFGQEKTEVENYERFLDSAQEKDKEQVFLNSLSYSTFQFSISIYTFFGYYVASVFVLNMVGNPNRPGTLFDGSDFMICFNLVFAAIITYFTILPNVKSLVKGKIAAGMAFATIER